MVMKDNGRNHNDPKKNNDRRKRQTQGNKKKHNERKRGYLGTEERGWSNLERRQSGVHGRKNLCTKQQEDQGGNLKRKS